METSHITYPSPCFLSFHANSILRITVLCISCSLVYCVWPREHYPVYDIHVMYLFVHGLSLLLPTPAPLSLRAAGLCFVHGRILKAPAVPGTQQALSQDPQLGKNQE